MQSSSWITKCKCCWWQSPSLSVFVQRPVQQYTWCLAIGLQSQLCWMQLFWFNIHYRMYWTHDDTFLRTPYWLPWTQWPPIVSAVMIVCMKTHCHGLTSPAIKAEEINFLNQCISNTETHCDTLQAAPHLCFKTSLKLLSERSIRHYVIHFLPWCFFKFAATCYFLLCAEQTCSLLSP